MARYSDEIIDEVRQTNDIVDVISQYVRLKRIEVSIMKKKFQFFFELKCTRERKRKRKNKRNY